MKTAYMLACALLLAACEEQPKENSDFGAAQAARSAAAADRACAAAGFEDLKACTEAPAQDARIAAKIAISMTETFTSLCAADLGRDRCDDMLMMAYNSIPK